MANQNNSNLIRTKDLLLKDHGTLSIVIFTGEDRNQTDNFLSKIDDLITVYGQSDAQANRLAIMVIESIPDSPNICSSGGRQIIAIGKRTSHIRFLLQQLPWKCYFNPTRYLPSQISYPYRQSQIF